MSEPLTRSTNATGSTPAPLSCADAVASVGKAVLRGAARGLCCELGGFQAAELWLLDDASRSLRLAARWAEKASPLYTAPGSVRRRLADAPADVAALSGGAVVLEDPHEGAGWDLHASSGAAIGLPVASDTTIHGVLWLLRDQPLVIADEAVELAEIVAARLALEVEKQADSASAARPVETTSAPAEPESADSLEFHEDHGPSAFREPQSVIVPPVEAAAWAAPHVEGLAAAGCWEMADGRLLALAAAAIDSPESSAATQRAAVEWLMEEAPLVAQRASDAGLLLTLLNRRMIESPLAGEGLAVTAALVDAPEDAEAGLGGVGTWAQAGPAIALDVRAAATSTHAGELVPLGWTEPEGAYAPRPFELAVRERLVLTAGDPRLTSPLVERRLGDVYRAATSDAHREMTPESCLRRLAAGGADDVLAAVALRRN